MGFNVDCLPSFTKTRPRTKAQISEVIEGHKEVIHRHKRQIKDSIKIIRGRRDAIKQLEIERDMAFY